jgi:uncharacterized repeat protein (TIGR01451 family)
MAAVSVVGCGLAWPAAAQLQPSPPVLSAPVAPHSVTIDLQSLTAAPEPKTVTVPEGELEPSVVPGRPQPLPDPVIQSGGEVQRDAIGLISAPVVNVAGITANANPPDTVGDVGRNHYVQMVNATQFQIFDKQGNALTGALNFGALWNAVGGNCTGNLGDPIVVYDHLADRWLLSQFANPNHMCIAISQTPDPTAGTWFLYEFDTGSFPDYQKFGVWPDGYYMSTFEGALGVYVFDRANMLLGNAVQFFKTTLANPVGPNRNTRILPADLDGPPPPDGTPNFFVRTVDNLQDNANPNDRIEIYEARVDWLNLTFTFTLVDDLRAAQGLAPFNTMACNRNGGGIRDCIPQPTAAANTIDALSNRPMMQLKFRTVGSDQRMVFNQTIDVSGSIPNSLNITPADEVAGVRWYELRKPAANWTIRQQGTYAPQPNNATAENQLLHRWMGSAAMDKHGNIALGYSITNADTANPIFAGIRYTGRRFDDPLGLMPQGEQVILNGANAQIQGLGARWGDYSAMSVDPVDDCTFWFTNHVAGIGGAGARPTRIASFRFDTCGTDLAIQKTANPGPVVAGDQLVYTVTVHNNGPDKATGVTVVDTLPAGVTYLADTDACVAAPPTLTCSLPDLAAGASASFEIRVRVSAGLTATAGPTTITNTATVSADQQDLDESNNTASVTTLIEELADLRITKLCKPDSGPAPAGSTGTCTIVVDNLGPSDARGVIVTDTHVGSGSFSLVAATFVSTSPAASGNCVIAGGVVTCDLGRENAGGRTTITVDVTSNGSVDVNDFATVASATPDPNLADNGAAGSVSFHGSADLSLTKSDNPDPVTAGQTLTYSLTVHNHGPSPVPNVVVRDVLPKEVALVSATPTQGACAGTTVPGDPAQPLTCTLNTIANGASATITVVVAVKPDTAHGAILINNASVASDYVDPNNANNVSTASTTVQTRADLAIVKTSDADTYKPSSTVTYRIDVTNNGPSVARAVVVVDNLPEVRQALYQSDTGGCVRESATDPTMLRCELGDLGVAEHRTFHISLLVRGNRGVVSNTATVGSDTTDPVGANNSSTKDVIVGK